MVSWYDVSTSFREMLQIRVSCNYYTHAPATVVSLYLFNIKLFILGPTTIICTQTTILYKKEDSGMDTVYMQ